MASAVKLTRQIIRDRKKAANIIQKRGFGTGKVWVGDSGPVCLLGAVALAIGVTDIDCIYGQFGKSVDPHLKRVVRSMGFAGIGSVFDFNDSGAYAEGKEKRKEKVIARLLDGLPTESERQLKKKAGDIFSKPEGSEAKAWREIADKAERSLEESNSTGGCFLCNYVGNIVLWNEALGHQMKARLELFRPTADVYVWWDGVWVNGVKQHKASFKSLQGRVLAANFLYWQAREEGA